MASSSKEPSKIKEKNRLALEKSPYLLQHAENPVQWYPWGNEAFELARKENKLIFLSIGYSTCHWCHVMERESFENPETANVMNRYYVNIKVDKEERPDLNDIYMTFILSISGHGGWPISVFLTPDLKPITGGTYFPPRDTPLMPSFKNVLLGIAHNWQDSEQEITEAGSKLLGALRKGALAYESMYEDIPLPGCAILCVKQYTNTYDKVYGGFSHAPKFPQPANWNFLLHMYVRDPQGDLGQECLDMCLHSLRMMARGGIHDHIGQGFARYSVDHKWHVPHFEKMLYDQAQLLHAYSEAYIVSKDKYFAEIIDDIATYVYSDLRHPEGAFYSAEDADSYPFYGAPEKMEGAFYVWKYEELKQLLNKSVHGSVDLKLLDIVCFHYNVGEKGNITKSQDPHGELTGQNVLFMKDEVEKTASHFKCSVEEMKDYLQEARKMLFNARLKRPRPHLDDKIVTAWNGLMISGLTHAGIALGQQLYIQLAIDAAKFIERYAYDSNKETLLRCCYRGDNDAVVQTSVPINGFHADYACYTRGLIDLYEACFDEHWLELAEKLQNTQDKLFWDSSNGGYYNTTTDDSSILLRLKERDDGAEPSSNSIACNNLIKLAAFFDRDDFKEKAERLLCSYHKILSKAPMSAPLLVSSLINYHDSTTQIFVVGKRNSEDTEEMLKVINGRLLPGKALMFVDEDKKETSLFSKNHVVTNLKMIQNRATVYVCHHHTCSLPVNSPEDLASLLDSKCTENLTLES
ncbi:spermatogenesis-associated protein 20 isoform X2 [Prorops nasuta]